MIKEKLIIGGRKRNIYTGSKGGKYYMKGGKKRYINNKMKGGSGYKYISKNGNKFDNITLEKFLKEAKLNQYSNRPLSLNDIKKKSMEYYQANTTTVDKERIWKSLGIEKEFHAKRLLREAKQLTLMSNNSSNKSLNKKKNNNNNKSLLNHHLELLDTYKQQLEKSNPTLYNAISNKNYNDVNQSFQNSFKRRLYANAIIKNPIHSLPPSESELVIKAWNHIKRNRTNTISFSPKPLDSRTLNNKNDSSNNSPINSLTNVEKTYNKNGKSIYIDNSGKEVTKNEYNNYITQLQEIQSQCDHDFRLNHGTNGAGRHGSMTYVCNKCGFSMSSENYNKYVKQKQKNCEHVIEVVHGNSYKYSENSYVCKKCGKTNLTEEQYNNYIANTTQHKECEHDFRNVKGQFIATLGHNLYRCKNCKQGFSEQNEEYKKWKGTN